MSEHAHHGTHPEADLLSSFAEGVLPEHERLACLDHLAACPQCREIVFLTQAAADDDAVPEKQPVPPVSFWKRWLRPVPVLSATAATALLVVSIAVSHHPTPPAPLPELTARVEAPPPLESPALREPEARPSQPKSPPARKLAKASAAPAAAPAPPQPVSAFALDGIAPAAAPPPPPASQLAGVTGTITDPAGAAIANAQVKLTDAARDQTFRTATDTSGQFAVTNVPPGRYQLNFASPGFQQRTNNIDLQPQQVARADSVLAVGSVSESIAVTAEAAGVQTSPASAAAARGGRAPAPVTFASKVAAAAAPPAIQLPNGQSSATTATKGTLIVATDPTGALFRSTDSGKSWKPVKGKWQGKVIRLQSPPAPPGALDAVFQLNTDAGEIWLSKDGNRWQSAPAAH
jgi:hypothetical protein